LMPTHNNNKKAQTSSPAGTAISLNVSAAWYRARNLNLQ